MNKQQHLVQVCLTEQHYSYYSIIGELCITHLALCFILYLWGSSLVPTIGTFAKDRSGHVVRCRKGNRTQIRMLHQMLNLAFELKGKKQSFFLK